MPAAGSPVAETMPAERERRFSRLTALLRRPSSSSAKNASVDSTTSTSTSSTTPTTSPITHINSASTEKSDTASPKETPKTPWHSFATPYTPNSAPTPTSTATATATASAATTIKARRTALKSPEEADGPALKGQKLGAESWPNRALSLSNPSRTHTPTPQATATALRSASATPRQTLPVPLPLIETPGPASNLPLARARVVSVDGGKDAAALRRFEDYTFASSAGQDPAQFQNRAQRQPVSRGSVVHSTRQLNALDESRQSLPASACTTPVPGRVPQNIDPKAPRRPTLAVRRQSLVPASQQRLINTLLDPPYPNGNGADYFARGTPTIRFDMINRKVWVKRPGSSPTLVLVTEEDLVDDLRDAILKKYANSLGRTIDSPDITIRLVQREPSSRHGHQERVLGPEEPLARTLDHFYPGGQTIDEALIIEVPTRRTPKPSPLTPYTHPDDPRAEPGEYFPPMHMITNSASLKDNMKAPHQPSMAVLTTGQLPALPSPGNRGSWPQPPHRGSYPHNNSQGAPASLPSPSTNDSVNPPTNGVATASSPPSTTTPPALSEPASKSAVSPPSRVSSPRPTQVLRKLNKNSSTNSDSLPTSLLDGAIPPINVLIVEDNTINLKLLEAFMKRLKVRWQTAMNGREAVNKWREGGFHLVLMDIQLPVMNGLEATREIRRLERVNNIGVFQRSVSGPSYSATMVGSPPASPALSETPVAQPAVQEEVKPEDMLNKENQFKSPVIIVALTASSLQSDRHEALAAGCNDFLTKPVNIVWLEQKVTEWGCMQALIDFEGWRKWRGFNDLSNVSNSANGKPKGNPNSGFVAADLTPRKPHAVKPVPGKASSGNIQPKPLPAATAAAAGVYGEGAEAGADDSSSTVNSTKTVVLSTESSLTGSGMGAGPSPVASRRFPVATKAMTSNGNANGNGNANPQAWKNAHRNSVPTVGHNMS
ncbi:response regulator mcs4 [Arthroderma uncinatum]|uniref:response regulator mcs4 n=1 Tax=Arthroderma uncinatum TaxID=74035 RepID=UPI00144AE774|nr:response regulator mcs4 [Arthroderma uncinatum]KAF3480092.1 response regulator mcs4 [Arthroderma uncinatum]